MGLAILNGRQLLALLLSSRYLSTWRVLLLLMAFFLVGYVISAILVFQGINDWLLILMGVVFLFGAAFVWMVVRISRLTINDLLSTLTTKDALEKEVQQRTHAIALKNAALVQSQQALAEARDEAVQANDAKSLFLANMSHEIRTPINAIVGYSELLFEDAENSGDELLMADLDRIVVASHHLLELISGILDLSKIEAGQASLSLEQFAVREVVERVIGPVRLLAERNRNEFVYEISPEVGDIYSDNLKLRQMLFNLLSNACRFTQNGRVALDVAVDRSIGGRETIVFEVSDTGIGMTDAQLRTIYDPFTQAADDIAGKYGGTGLGLAITKRFCDLMQGEMAVWSRPGQGSRFIIRLPRALKSEKVPA